MYNAHNCIFALLDWENDFNWGRNEGFNTPLIHFYINWKPSFIITESVSFNFFHLIRVFRSSALLTPLQTHLSNPKWDGERKSRVTTNPLQTTPTQPQCYILHSYFDNWREWDNFCGPFLKKLSLFSYPYITPKCMTFFFSNKQFFFAVNFRSVVSHIQWK